MVSWFIVPRNKLDVDAWNTCVKASNDEHIYGYTWYMDVVAPDWLAVVFGEYQQVIPIPVKQKMGVNYVFQPEFYQRTSIFSKGEPKKLTELQNLLLNQFVKIDLTSTNDIFNSGVQLNNIIYKYNTDSQRISTNTLRNIKKAIAAGLAYSIGSLQDLNLGIDLFIQNTRFKLPNNYSDSITKIANELDRNESLAIRTVEKQGEVMAFCILAKSESRITLLLVATSEAGKKLGASHLLISEAIQEFAQQVETFDFEGSQNSGISRFYLSFGGEIEHYYHYNQKMQKGVINRIINSVK